MKIIRTSEQPTQLIYGMQCRHILEMAGENKLPFGSMHCVIEAGQQSTIHNHHERECVYITRGSGVVRIGQKQENVREGDIVFISPYLDHVLINPSAESLNYLTIWWEDMEALAKAPNESLVHDRTLIFSTPPTPNGDLHLGHLSGPYTGADIYRRFLELGQRQAFHVTGRDDNQSYVPRKALDQQRAPQELADDYSGRMLETLVRNNIRVDHFSHPLKSPWHVSLVQYMVQRLYQRGYIISREVSALYCKESGEYLYEAHVRGGCPHCASESDGNACEQCGRPNDVVDLRNPQSKYGGTGIEERSVRKLYFRLSAFADELKQYHREVVMPAHLAALCQRMLAAGLPDICVSHPVNWGIPVPVTGFTEQRIYVWFEMAAGYLAAAQEMAEKAHLSEYNDGGWRKFYSDPQSQVVHFFGFDNSYFHALLFPAIYMALDQNIQLPRAFVVNELLNLNGLKFSTSRGHLILGRDLLQWVPPDYVRYYLSLIRPEMSKTNFTINQFVETIERDLRTGWQGWLKSTLARAKRLFPVAVPAPGAWSVEQRSYFERITRLLSEAELAYQPKDFSPQRICRLSNELVCEAQRFSDGQAYYEDMDVSFNLMRTSVALELLTIRTLAQIVAPIMPDVAQTLQNILEPAQTLKWEYIPRFIHEGGPLGNVPEEFFPQIPDAVYGLAK